MESTLSNLGVQYWNTRVGVINRITFFFLKKDFYSQAHKSHMNTMKIKRNAKIFKHFYSLKVHKEFQVSFFPP